MSGLLAYCCAQTEFVWKIVDLYGRRTDWRNSPFMGGVVPQRLIQPKLSNEKSCIRYSPLVSRLHPSICITFFSLRGLTSNSNFSGFVITNAP
jgi:hypothetical protein